MGECDEVLTLKILFCYLFIGLLRTKISKLAKIMCAQTPRQLPAAIACLLPLSPEIKIVCVTCCEAVGQDLEGGAAATSLLHVAVGDLTGQLVEIVGKVV